MKALTATLLAAQKEESRDALWKIVLSKAGEDTVTYELDRIKYLQHRGGESSHRAQVLLDNTDKALRDLDLKGYQGDISIGCVTPAGEEYSQEAPLWVLVQQLYSLQTGKLYCSLILGGMINLLNLDKATASYVPDSGDTRTVKDWLIEILSLTDTGSESTEEQTTADTDMPLYDGLRYYAGQRLTISDRRVTKLAFYLRKVGNPTGNVTFYIDDIIGNELAKKVWGNAFDLGTGYGWKEVTFDPPIYINEEVRIHCEFLNGDASNYVDLAYKASSVKADEYLTEKYTGVVWTDEATYDAAYRYSYSATPITGYSHCPSIGLVFDSEDSIIDSFQPKDSLRIARGQTRKALVDKLLGWTGCVSRPENDGKLHIFVPKKDTSTTWVASTAYSLRDEIIPTTANGYVYICTTAGTSDSSEPTFPTGIGDTVADGTVVWTVAYDYEFELADDDAGKHTFYDKAYNKRLVMPSQIVVSSRSTDTPQYSGSATTSDHSSRPAHLQKRDDFEVRLASSAQGTSIATAKIARLERDAETGSARVPMNVGSEVYDFVNFVDDREGVSRNGVIRQITKTCKAGEGEPIFQMEVRFGLIAGEATLGVFPTGIAPMNLEMNFQLLVDQMMQIQEQINTLWENHSLLYDGVISITEILENMREYWLIAELYAYNTLRIPSEAA